MSFDRDPTADAAFRSGGQSSGDAFPNDVADDGDGRFEGGQSVRDYHGPRDGGSSNEATGGAEAAPDKPKEQN